jgi:hypothetical protein
MSGIRLWRCSRCYEQVGVVVDHAKLFCGDCFYRQTVERVMSAAFATASDSAPPPAARGAATAQAVYSAHSNSH